MHAILLIKKIWGELWSKALVSDGEAKDPQLPSKNFFFLSFSLSAIFWLLAIFPFLWLLNESTAAWSTLVCAMLMAVNVYGWHRFGSILLAHFVFQSALIGVILYNAYQMGGITSPSMVWLGIVPILPFFVVSRSWSYFWIVVSFGLVVLMYGLEKQNSFVHTVPMSPELWAIMIGLLAVTQVMLIITYDKANAQLFLRVQLKNERLKHLSDRLQALNSEKDKFLATVSHELRTPLNAIVGYLALLESNPSLPPESREYARHANNSTALLLTVINDLLDFSQIKQGQFAFNPQIVNTHKVLCIPHELLKAKARAQGLDFSMHLADELPTSVHLDPDRLCQIILNLLNNAIKFTPHGSVSYTAEFRTAKEFEGHLYLKIADTGVGIPPQSQQIIFEPFVQLDNHPNLGNDDALRGNGLGLSIIQNLIQAWGGSIQVSSQVGVGSTFEIWLPVKTVAAAMPEPTSEATPFNEPVYLESRRILIVDDHALNRMVASATILQQMPNTLIDEAKNGAEAFAKMSTQSYDLVLMDLVMPDMGGVEVVRKVRQECATPFAQVRVAAFTANLAEDAVQECLSVGMQDILSKPLNKDSLFRVIRQP